MTEQEYPIYIEATATNGTLTINCAYEDKWNEILITNQSKSKFPLTWTIECETVSE